MDSSSETPVFETLNLEEVFSRFDWGKAMIYTPYNFVFSISREDYLKLKLTMLEGILETERIISQASSFTFVSEDLRQMDWLEVVKIIKFETFLDKESSDILYHSVYKAYPEKKRQKHRASHVEKQLKLLKLLNK